MHPLEKRILLPENLRPIENLAEYKAIGGFEGLEKARSMSPQMLIKEVMASGLRGRGGAGFPTGVKWDTVFNDPFPHKYVVCNFAEGEPGTNKDRYLISKNPYVVFEGMLIAAHAVGAEQAIIGTKAKFVQHVQRLAKALHELEQDGIIKHGDIRVVLGPDDYLFGEEKALLEVIDGRGAMPRMYPPFMVGVGYTPTATNPTVVNNAESMSHLPHILRNGADWFKKIGSEDTSGTMIMTLTGDVKKPGMYEVPLGVTLGQLLNDLGGGPATDKPLKGVFSGVANAVALPKHFDLPLEFTTMREAGIGLGSGGFMAYDESRWMVDVAWMFSNFLSRSSCGQCIPCNSGTKEITGILEKIRNDGGGTDEDLESILVECGRCTNQTRCFLPVQESKLVPSIIDAFRDEFAKGALANGNWNRDIVVPKIYGFDDETQEFTFEEHPKEFMAEV